MLGRTPISVPHLAGFLLGIVVLAAATGAAFAAWIDSGAEIFRAMVEAGLAWCT